MAGGIFVFICWNALFTSTTLIMREKIYMTIYQKNKNDYQNDYLIRFKINKSSKYEVGCGAS